jgi:polyhydroxyalkanoate synthase
VLLADAAAGPLRQFAPDASTAKFAVALARRPVTTARRLGSLAAELARISAGTSAGSAKQDRRFADPPGPRNLLRRASCRRTAAGRDDGRPAGQ